MVILPSYSPTAVFGVIPAVTATPWAPDTVPLAAVAVSQGESVAMAKSLMLPEIYSVTMVTKRCPGVAGVLLSKPEKAAYTVSALTGSTAIPETQRFGRGALEMVVQVAPPSAVAEITPPWLPV